MVTPGFYGDLNFDQIVAGVTAGKEEYDLAPFFTMPLHDSQEVAYRQEVMQDLERPEVRRSIETFAARLREVRANILQTKQGFYDRQKERWLLDAASEYTAAVTELFQGLSAEPVRSKGLTAIRTYLDEYLKSKPFAGLSAQVKDVENDLQAIRYEVLIEGLRVEVRLYHKESDYSTEIRSLFQRFAQEAHREYDYSFQDKPDMNHVEGWILDRVAKRYPEPFAKLAAFYQTHAQFLDETITRFDREVQFYLAYLAYTRQLKKEGLRFCYPAVSTTDKEVRAEEAFDLALAHKLTEDHKKPITNDFYLKGKERIIVVSGPNQGGKTTFARMFGQLHYLAGLGLPVPGTSARLYLPDCVLTHFEKEEQLSNLRGKLEDDLVRMHDILAAATPRSIILINEIFTSTTLHDAVALSKKIGGTIMKLDALCVWVTFIDEVAALGEKTVSMVSTVIPDTPAERTFKIVRRPADGLAYALSIAEKYKLTTAQIRKRVKA